MQDRYKMLDHRTCAPEAHDRSLPDGMPEQAWTGSDADLAMARDLINDELSEYCKYVNGECYSYTVTDADGNEVATCSGLIGYEYAVREAKQAVPAGK